MREENKYDYIDNEGSDSADDPQKVKDVAEKFADFGSEVSQSN